MHIVSFKLSGELAMWRHVEDAKGSYSCLGPAPSNIAGICGAAFGFASPVSVAGLNRRGSGERNSSRSRDERRPLWPISSELLLWQEEVDYHIACALTSRLRRSSYNVNGYKLATEWGNLQMPQSVLIEPEYQIAVGVKEREQAIRLRTALENPIFPIYLGASFCRGFITDVCLLEQLNSNVRWAQRVPSFGDPEATPFSTHVTCGFPRITTDGYWNYKKDGPVNLVRGFVQTAESPLAVGQ